MSWKLGVDEGYPVVFSETEREHSSLWDGELLLDRFGLHESLILSFIPVGLFSMRI